VLADSARAAGGDLDRFAAALEKLRSAARIPGLSAAIVQDGRVVFARGFGFANLGEERSLDARDSLQHRVGHEADLRGGANLKIEKLSGDLKIGGRLAGKITGAKKEGEQPYSWDVDFDLALPAKAAAAGPSCGS